MKTIYKITITGLLALPLVSGLFSSCSDSWDDHFDEQRMASDKSLLELIRSNDELSDFLRVLETAHVYNNNHTTPVTFAQLLDADQSLTVWAPKNGTFNCDSLLRDCLTQEGDSMVGLHFLGNHIAHTLFNADMGDEGSSILMMNNKQVLGSQFDINPSSYNIPAMNGLLHVVDTEVPYNYNIYEGLTSMSKYQLIGKFLKRYETQELDEDASIQRGIDDGRIVYSDSVMNKVNILYNTFGKINSEDSTYFMFVPDETSWKQINDEAEKYFNYGSVLKADSISEYWKNVSLMQGLFYNRNVQYHIMDSINSTMYSQREPEYNVFYRPFDEGGILTSEYIADSLYCSNGTIYTLKKWPFTKEQLYFRPITVETEQQSVLVDSKDCTFNYRTILADSVSNNGYLDIVQKSSTSNWNASFRIANTLSGTYDLYVVILPKQVNNKNSRDFKPNKFVASLSYKNVDGSTGVIDFDEAISNDPYHVDTLKIGRVTLPTCNYRQQDVTVTLTITCKISNRETKFSREMYLDCIYLKPIDVTEPNESKKR